jgi:hypothetical protein
MKYFGAMLKMLVVDIASDIAVDKKRYFRLDFVDSIAIAEQMSKNTNKVLWSFMDDLLLYASVDYFAEDYAYDPALVDSPPTINVY